MAEVSGNAELLEAVIQAIVQGRGHIKALLKELEKCVQLLRVEPSRGTFTTVSNNIESLRALMEFGEELRSGLTRLAGADLVVESILPKGDFLNVFQAMMAGFESRDWVTLADLIQYELLPLVQRSEEDLALLEAKLLKK